MVWKLSSFHRDFLNSDNCRGTIVWPAKPWGVQALPLHHVCKRSNRTHAGRAWLDRGGFAELCACYSLPTEYYKWRTKEVTTTSTNQQRLARAPGGALDRSHYYPAPQRLGVNLTIFSSSTISYRYIVKQDLASIRLSSAARGPSQATPWIRLA